MNEIEHYDYELPRERIAQDPLPTRSDARLMLVDRNSGEVDHYYVRDLPELLRPSDVLVMNDSRVVPARLVGFRTQTGGRWQGLFLRSDDETGIWEVLTKTRGKLVPGETISIQDRNARDSMQLVVVARTKNGHLLVSPQLPDNYVPLQGEKDVADLVAPADWLQQYGRIPLPPYIRDGQMVDSDIENYQTVYARHHGSVAAPTAGLHFTKKLLQQIRDMGVATTEVTLHVGVGTFRPIQVQRLEEHTMHQEWGDIDSAAAAMISGRRDQGGRCVAVGTTSVRVLESAAAGSGRLEAWTGNTDLFIRPSHEFRVVDALMTNFHLPRSSLLVLVSAFASRELALHAYEVAIRNEYRFYSYGDAMLIV